MTAAAVPALRIDAAAGLLLGVRQVLSPYRDARPAQALPELIIVHGISLPAGEFGGPWISFSGTLPAYARGRRAPLQTATERLCFAVYRRL